LFGAREVKKLLALSLLFGSALIVFYFAPTPPSRGQNEARRQTADVAHPFRHNGELQAFAKAYVKWPSSAKRSGYRPAPVDSKDLDSRTLVTDSISID